MFNEGRNFPASSGIARVLHLDPGRHISSIVQSRLVIVSHAQPVQKAHEPRVVSRTTSGQELSKNKSGDCRPRYHHFLKWSFTIPVGEGAGKNVFSGIQTCGAESAGKI